MPNCLFSFRTDLLGDKRSPVTVIKGSRDWIERYISTDELIEIFGGYAEWRRPDEITAEMPGEALGVWGHRKTSKLRRILRERGAIFEVRFDEGPAQGLVYRVTQGKSTANRLDT